MYYSALVPLAEGFEEIEAVTIIDVLRRAGLDVTVAGLVEGPIRASRGVVVVPDTTLERVVGQIFDLVVLPGGLKGAEGLAEDRRVLKMLRSAHEEGNLVAALCAAPLALDRAGLLGERFTCHPSVKDRLPSGWVDERVVMDGRIITSQGPGTAFEFVFTLVSILLGPQKVEELNRGILAPRTS